MVRDTHERGRTMRTPTVTELAKAVVAAALVSGGLVTASMSSGNAAMNKAETGVSPAQFNDPKPNAYFPLVPGTVTRYRGSAEGEKFREALTITHREKLIEGVRTTVVLDVTKRADGTLAEKTQDWYAGDNDGNVWYFGERTATYDKNGNVLSRDGSFEAGVDGARAGQIMVANPIPTDAYRQELHPGQAVDQAWIVQNDAKVSGPSGRFDRVVRSFEWTRLEPNIVSLKFYAPGVGIVLEKDVAGGDERFELVSVHRR